MSNTCTGCEDCQIPGVRWPSAANCDESHDWIERCDYCEVYVSDHAAAAAVEEATGRRVVWGRPVGAAELQPYLDISVHDALTAVGEEGGVEAVALVGALMDQNARHLESTFESLYESEKAAHEFTKDQLQYALERLDRIDERMHWLAGHGECAPS